MYLLILIITKIAINEYTKSNIIIYLEKNNIY